jgi:hypothetical protein
MLEFLIDRYYELYDLPNFYLGIEEPWKCHLFSILFIVILIILTIWVIKTGKEIYLSKIERIKQLRKIQKTLMKPYDNKNKNKKNIT